jgi:glyoxylase-like metal-dependent hydrolase (beta-lactamase superfamily II)
MIQANCYILGDEETREAVVIDPGGDVPVVLRSLEAAGLQTVAILATHGHFDHVEGLAAMKQALGAPIHLHRDDLPLVQNMANQGAMFGIQVQQAPEPDRYVADGDTIAFGSLALEVLHTPGHSPGSVSYRVGDRVFVGDLLFAGSIGRTDLTGGDYATLLRSVREKIFTLGDATTVYPGHGPATTVGAEKRTNPFFQ